MLLNVSLRFINDSHLINFVYAQLSSSSSSLSSLPPSNLLGVKILSPTEGQSIDVTGGNLIVSGTSSYDYSNDCSVTIIVNDIKPYQKVIASGNKGENDYSEWKYVLDPSYTTIQQGSNKVTSKITCSNIQGQSIKAKWYSVNIIGYNKNENNLGVAKISSPSITRTVNGLIIDPIDKTSIPFNNNITRPQISSKIVSNANGNDGESTNMKMLTAAVTSMVIKRIHDTILENSK